MSKVARQHECPVCSEACCRQMTISSASMEPKEGGDED